MHLDFPFAHHHPAYQLAHVVTPQPAGAVAQAGAQGIAEGIQVARREQVCGHLAPAPVVRYEPQNLVPAVVVAGDPLAQHVAIANGACFDSFVQPPDAGLDLAKLRTKLALAAVVLALLGEHVTGNALQKLR